MTLRRLALAAIGATMVALVVLRYPPPESLSFDPRLFLAFDSGKAGLVLRGLAGLLALNLAAFGLGGPLRRRLFGGRPGAIARIEALALGFVVLADLVLLLAALRLLDGAVLATLVLVPAAAGAHRLWRERPARFSQPAWLWLAGAALVASPLLAAWVPDYGWDAFAYHLAIPERYLFRNRIVLTPLFPHSAFPHTVEMLYLLALAFDPGPLAKLLHLEFGVLAAAAAWALASRHSQRAGMLAVAILAADPLFNWELAVAYNDLAACLFALLAAGAWLDQRAGEPRALWRCGLFAGACLAVRYPAGTVPLSLMAATLVAGGSWQLRLKRALVIGGLATAVLAPWLLRNLALTGNPVAPALQRVFHEPGREFFDPLALEQGIVFTRGVGMGRGLDDLLLLPLNITLRARLDAYDAFGFRLGPLVVIGTLACLLLPVARASPTARPLLLLAGSLVLLWFYSFQEPRYLLPALGLLAVAGAVGLDAWLSGGGRRWAWAWLWLIPIAALFHTQREAALLLPYRYGYTLGALSVEAFESQEPALVAAKRLRAVLGPGDRLLLVYENRGYFCRGLDYVLVNWPELMLMLHREPDATAFRGRLDALGVTHVLVNPENLRRYRTWFVPGWSERDFAEDLRRLQLFLDRETVPVLSERDVFVRMLRPGVARSGS